MANNITRWTKENPPPLLLSIDPGAADRKSKGFPYAGCALFQLGMLVWAALVRCPTTVPPFGRPYALVDKVCEAAMIPRNKWQAGAPGQPRELLTVLAVENPLIYTHGTAKPSDIVNLKGIYGAFMGGIEAEFYSGPAPSEWKGSIDKKIMNERVAKVLNSSERIVLIQAQAAGYDGLSVHVIDAAGLGVFVLGRADKAMVI
jgi:hypothetical protein